MTKPKPDRCSIWLLGKKGEKNSLTKAFLQFCVKTLLLQRHRCYFFLSFSKLRALETKILFCCFIIVTGNHYRHLLDWSVDRNSFQVHILK